MKQIIKNISNSRIFSMVKVLLFVAVCAAIGITAGYIHHESDPTEVAVEYFKAFMKQDYQAMKKMIDVSEESYLDDKALGAIIAKQKQDLNVDKYEVMDPKKEKGKNLVVIECSNEQTGEKKNFKIYLNSYRKGLSLKPSYKVDFGDYLVEDYQIVIPKDDSLQLNGVDIDSKLSEITKEGKRVYKFSQVLKGEYNIASSNEYGVYSKKIDIKDNKTKTELDKITYLAQADYKAKVEEAFNGMFQQYYAAVRKKSHSEKEYLQFFEKSAGKKAKKAVDSSINIMFDEAQREKYDVSNMDIKDLKSTVTYNKKKQQFDMVSSYQLKYDCTTSTSLINSYTESYSGSCKVTMKASISVGQKEYKIKDISIKNVKDKKKEE